MGVSGCKENTVSTELNIYLIKNNLAAYCNHSSIYSGMFLNLMIHFICYFSFNVMRQILVIVDMHRPHPRIMKTILGLLTMVLIREDMMIILVRIMVVDLTLHKIKKISKRET